MTSKFYNERVECRKHEGEIAAICPRCYDAALTQQERERLHAGWLECRSWGCS